MDCYGNTEKYTVGSFPLSQGQKLSYFLATRSRKLPSQDVSISANADTIVRSFYHPNRQIFTLLLLSHLPKDLKLTSRQQAVDFILNNVPVLWLHP